MTSPALGRDSTPCPKHTTASGTDTTSTSNTSGPDGTANDPRSRPAATIPVEAVAAYAELSKIVLGEQSLTAVVHRIAELAAQILPHAREVSVTLLEAGRARSVAFTGDLAADLDERQYADGFGPCMDAAVTGRTITVADTAKCLVYQDFAHQARRHGISRTLSVGMPTSRRTSGAINIYATGLAGPFGQVTHDVATSFAGYAAIALLNVATYAHAADEVAQLRQALVSRAGIEQAKGIIMYEQHCSAEEAFDVLRLRSSTANRKLRDVAQTIVDETATLSSLGGQRAEEPSPPDSAVPGSPQAARHRSRHPTAPTWYRRPPDAR